MKRILTLLAIATFASCSIFAQDDMYFTPKSKAVKDKEKAEAKAAKEKELAEIRAAEEKRAAEEEAKATVPSPLPRLCAESPNPTNLKAVLSRTTLLRKTQKTHLRPSSPSESTISRTRRKRARNPTMYLSALLRLSL